MKVLKLSKYISLKIEFLFYVYIRYKNKNPVKISIIFRNNCWLIKKKKKNNIRQLFYIICQ